MTHCTDVCLCGTVQYDCLCPGMKPTRVVQHTCAKCVRDAPRELLGGVEFEASKVVPVEQCMSEEDARSNRDVRLGVYQVVANLSRWREMPNPQELIRQVHERVDVPPMWTQLVRDLISEALGEERLRRRSENLVKDVDPKEWEAVADQVLSEHPNLVGAGNRVVTNLLVLVMKRTEGKADPGHVQKYLRMKLAG